MVLVLCVLCAVIGTVLALFAFGVFTVMRSFLESARNHSDFVFWIQKHNAYYFPKMHCNRCGKKGVAYRRVVLNEVDVGDMVVTHSLVIVRCPRCHTGDQYCGKISKTVIPSRVYNE